MPEEGLKNLIEQLQNSGTTDSSGVFTISAEKAREKLRQFQLTEPHQFVKNLVAAAVLGGATRVEFGLFNTGSSTWFDGQVYSTEQLEMLLHQLLSPEDPPLVELAVAVNTLRKSEETTIAFCSVGEDGQGSRLTIRGETFTVDSAAPQDRPGNTLKVTQAASMSRVWAGWRGNYAELPVLKQSCSYAPLWLEVNGRPIQEPIQVGRSPDCIAWLQLGALSGPEPPREPTSQWAPYCARYKMESGTEGFGCVIALSSQEQAREEGVGLLSNGVLFERSGAWLGAPMAHGVLWGPLDKNVSHTDLAENDNFNRLIYWGQTSIEWLLLQRMESELPIPEPSLTELLDWAPKLEERFHSRGEVDLAGRVRGWITETRFLLDLKDDVRFEQLLKALARITDQNVLASKRRKVGLALLQAAEMSLQAGNYQECQPLSLKLAVLDPQDSLAPCKELYAVGAALCGQNYPSDDLPDELRGELLRLDGKPAEALTHTQDPLQRAQVLMALQQHAKAHAWLRQQPIDSAEWMEALADCLAFAPERSRRDGLEALELKRRATEMREQAGVPLGVLLQHDLARLARSVAPLTTWIRYRASAGWTSSSFEAAQKVEQAMELVIAKLHRSSTALVQLHATLLHVEKAFPLEHLYVHAVRAKAVHALRRAGYWREADQILVRGRLLEHLLGLLRAPRSSKS